MLGWDDLALVGDMVHAIGDKPISMGYMLVVCHRPTSSCASSFTAGAGGFLMLLQCPERPERERGARDEGKAPGPVVPVAGEKPHARSVAAHEHSEAVVFDLVQPLSPSGRLGGWAWQARLAEVGEGYATQQHGV